MSRSAAAFLKEDEVIADGSKLVSPIQIRPGLSEGPGFHLEERMKHEGD